jgi:Anaphase-promoting complex subunit 4 WD40 domain
VLADGRFAGFLMPAVDTRQTVELHRITNPTDRRTAAGTAAWTKGFDWRYLVRTAANLAHATHVLHAAGVVIGDFNESNIRTWREARVTLLDCDSMQIRDPASGEWFFCRVGRPEFTPPELVRADWARTVRHPSSDLFALAIHLYQLLLEGEHPFRGVWRGEGDKPPVSVLAGQGIWAHQNGGPLVPRPAAISAGLLPPAIVAMFRHAFEDGAVDPGARPTAAQWHRALNELAAQLRQCPVNPAHFYPGSHDACPWCRYTPPPAWRPPPAPARPAVEARPPPARPRLPRRSRYRATTKRYRYATLGAGAVLVALGSVLAAATLAGGPPPRAAAPPGGSPARGAAVSSDPRLLTGAGLGTKAVAFSPSGGTLATGDINGRAYLWDTASGQRTATLTNFGRQPGSTIPSADSAAFSPGGGMLAVGINNGSTYLWNVATVRNTAVLTDPGASGNSAVDAVAFSPSGTLLATGDCNGSTYLWNLGTLQNVAALSEPRTGGACVTSVAFSPDGTMLATADTNGRAYLWDLATERVTATLPNGSPVTSVAFNPGGTMLATGSGRGVDLWVAATGQLAGRLIAPAEFQNVSAVAFGPGGKVLAAGNGGGSTVLWNIEARRRTATLVDPLATGGNPAAVNAVAISPDGSLLAAGDFSGTYLWHLRRP